MKQSILLIFGVIGITLVSSLALAHQPFYNSGSPSADKAFEIPDPTISKVITAQGKANQLDWYSLSSDQALKFNAAVFVAKACNEAYRPRLWLLGPKLKNAVADKPELLPKDLEAVVSAPGWEPYSGYGLTALKGKVIEQTLPAGKYTLVVENGAVGGWYFISMSGKEIRGGTPEGRQALARFNKCP